MTAVERNNAIVVLGARRRHKRVCTTKGVQRSSLCFMVLKAYVDFWAWRIFHFRVWCGDGLAQEPLSGYLQFTGVKDFVRTNRRGQKIKQLRKYKQSSVAVSANYDWFGLLSNWLPDFTVGHYRCYLVAEHEQKVCPSSNAWRRRTIHESVGDS